MHPDSNSKQFVSWACFMDICEVHFNTGYYTPSAGVVFHNRRHTFFTYLFVFTDLPVLFSVLLTVPSIMGVLYLLIFQVVVLRIEIIWCTLMLCIQLVEFVFASMFIVSLCRGPSYD